MQKLLEQKETAKPIGLAATTNNSELMGGAHLQAGMA
jgi:hypothetical protein